MKNQRCLVILLSLCSLDAFSQSSVSSSNDLTKLKDDIDSMYKILDRVNEDGLREVIDAFAICEKTMLGELLVRPLTLIHAKIENSLESIVKLDTSTAFYIHTKKEIQEYRYGLMRFQHEADIFLSRDKPYKMDVFSNNRFIAAYRHLGLSRSLLMAAMDNRLFYEENKNLGQQNLELSRDICAQIIALDTSVNRNFTKVDLHISASEKRIRKNAILWSLIGGAVGGAVAGFIVK